MKIVIFLLLIFFVITNSNAQFSFDQAEQDKVSELIDNGEYDAARSILTKLRTVDWKNLNCEEKTNVYKFFGNIHYYLFEDDKALKYYIDSSYLKVKDCGLKKLEIDLLNNIATIYKYADKPLLANKYYHQLKLIYLTNGVSPSNTSCIHLVNLASYYEDHGDLYNSFLCAWKAKQIGESLGLDLVDVHNAMGNYFVTTKQYQDALKYYNKASENYSINKNPIPTTLLYNKAMTYRYIENYTEARKILDELKIRNLTAEDRYEVLNVEAIIYTSLGKYDQAESTLKLLDKLTETNDLSQHHLENRADLMLQMGDISGAIKLYENRIEALEQKWKHLNYIPKYSPDLLEMTDLRCLISKAKYLDSKKGNIALRKEVIKNYEHIRSNVSQIVKSNWESQGSSHLLDEIYENLYYFIMSHIDEYTASGNQLYAQKAYQILTEFKNQILDRDIQNRMHLKENLPDTILTQYYKLKSDLNFSNESKDSTKRSFTSLIEKFEKHQLNFDSLLTEEKSIFSLNPKSLAGIQKTLKKEDAFLDIYYAKEKLIRFWVTKDEIKINSTDLPSDLLINFSNNLKTGISPNNIANDSIYMSLFLGINLVNTDNIIVNADGLFHKLPLGAIKNPYSNSYLIEDFSFRYLLSTDSIYTENYSWQGKSSLGVASDYSTETSDQIDSFAMDFGQLNSTIEELINLSEHYKSTSLINKKASFDNLQNQISDQNFNIVQLSLHGIIDDRYPALSGLIFENENGFEKVDLNRMTGLNLDTDLTIVNSCHSGDGKHITGEAISNLNTNLFISGSKANIVNLWSSSDKASSEILKSFHEQLSKGKSKSQALQLAKKEYLATASPSFKHSKYWSSLVLFGNDSPIHKTNFKLLYLSLSLLLVFIAYFFYKNNRKNLS